MVNKTIPVTVLAANFHSVKVDKVYDGVDILIPRLVVKNISSRFENTLYGYFIGKRIAFPVVEYFVKNNWAKFGLKRIMMNAKGFFFFKFESHTGLESVLEGGPWMIKNNPVILKEWKMNTSLLKEELNRKPIMLDAYTSSMCKDSWGRSSFARCLIEVSSVEPFKEEITIGIPQLEGDDFSKETIYVEYEWKPPRCDKWLPTRFQPKSHNGGTTGGGNRGTSSSKPSSSNNNDDTFINKKDTMKDKHKESDVVDKGIMKMSNITSPNHVLGSDEDEEEEVENIFDESTNLNLHNTRASTPANGALDV
ncbi:zinc knuckle CX2CX4HX4C containing protein [Tanacetum coccineum]